MGRKYDERKMGRLLDLSQADDASSGFTYTTRYVWDDERDDWRISHDPFDAPDQPIGQIRFDEDGSEFVVYWYKDASGETRTAEAFISDHPDQPYNKKELLAKAREHVMYWAEKIRKKD